MMSMLPISIHEAIMGCLHNTNVKLVLDKTGHAPGGPQDGAFFLDPGP